MQSLRSITIAYGIAFLLAILVASVLVYGISARSLIREVDTRLSTEANALVGDSAKLDLANVVEGIRRQEALHANTDLSYKLVDQRGKPLAGKLRMRLPPVGFSMVEYNDGVEGIDRGRALTTRLPGGSVLVIVADFGPIEDFNTRIFQIGTSVFLVTIAIGGLGALAFSRTISRRIEANTGIARSIIGGELGRRMPYDGTGGTFDRQAAVLNEMLDRIQMLMVNLQQISSDVAHDLRTPLTRLHNDAARLIANLTSKSASTYLEQILLQSEQLLTLFEAILRISEVEAGSRQAYFQTVDLGKLAIEVMTTMALAVEANAGTLIAGAIDPVSITGDRELLAQALINLIENADRYAGPGAVIKLSVRISDEKIHFTVRDDGPGIPPEERAKALRRFGRLDNSRSKPGNGLGLSLVDAIARLHGGSVQLGDANPGLAVIIIIPLNYGSEGQRETCGTPR